MKKSRNPSLRTELTAGLVYAVLGLPMSIGFGLFAFAPLGPGFANAAVLAGLYSAIVVPLVVVMLRGRGPLVPAPRAMPAFLISAVMLQLATSDYAPYLRDNGLLPAAAVLLLTLAGVFQIFLGVLRLGELMKFIPHPVIAGFQNSAALLLLLSQFDAVFGFKEQIPFEQFAAMLPHAQPLAFAVAVVTCLLMVQAPRITRRIPTIIVGMTGGVLVYYALFIAGFESRIGPMVGEVHLAFPDFSSLAAVPVLLADERARGLLPMIAAWSASIALISSLDTLLCAKVLEPYAGRRTEPNLDLTRQGIGNAMAAAAGGLTATVNITLSQANYTAGGRSGISVAAGAIAVMLIGIAMSDIVALLPKVVIGSLLVVMALRMFDPWTIQLLRSAIGRGAPRRRTLTLDLAIIALVMTVALASTLVTAVFVGVVVSVVSFLIRNSRSVVRRTYRGDLVHSRRARDSVQAALIADHGREIAVMELQGPIFFGTAERLATDVERLAADGARYVVLDLRRVTDLDTTGGRIMLTMHDALVRDGGMLALSAVEDGSRLADVLRDVGVTAALGRQRLFADADAALEWAEERVLLGHYGDQAHGGEFPLARLDVLHGLDDAELAVLAPLLERRTYAAGDVLFREGDEGKELFILARGTASVRLRLPGTARTTRLVTFAPGTVVGEMALLDTERRSATVQADETLDCYALPVQRFSGLQAERPDIALKLLANLSRELSGRLRRANRIIHQLDS